MDKKRRDELKALCDRATPGPWRKPDDDGSTSIWRQQHRDAHVVTSYGTPFALGVDTAACALEEDVAFIAAARTALPEALAYIEVLEADNQRFRGDSDRHATQRSHWSNVVGRIAVVLEAARAAFEAHQNKLVQLFMSAMGFGEK